MTFSRDFTGFLHINECGVNVKTLQSLKCNHSTSYDMLEKILITIDYVWSQFRVQLIGQILWI